MLRFWAGKGLETDAPRRGRETLRGREGRPYELYPASYGAPVDPDGGLPAEPEPREALGLTAMTDEALSDDRSGLRWPELGIR